MPPARATWRPSASLGVSTDQRFAQTFTAMHTGVVSRAQVAINKTGAGDFVMQILATNPGGGATVVNVGQLVGVPAGGNPHRWYSPSDVQTVIDAVTADYKKIAKSFPGKTSMISFQRSESQLKIYYDLLKNSNVEQLHGLDVSRS